MRLPQFRLRTLLAGIALLALILTVVLQAIWLRKAFVREQRLQADLRQAQTALVQAEWDKQFYMNVTGYDSWSKEWANQSRRAYQRFRANAREGDAAVDRESERAERASTQPIHR